MLHFEVVFHSTAGMDRYSDFSMAVDGVPIGHASIEGVD